MKAVRAGVFVGGLLGACSGSQAAGNDGFTYTLYRTSTVQPNARIHVATFDAQPDDSTQANDAYNQGNCEQARELFGAQPGIKVRYFCEKGRFQK